MSNNYNSVGKDNLSVSPKSYSIDQAIITANNGHEVELKNIVHDIKIHEGLHRSGIVVEIFLVDTANLTNELKLSGNEKIHLIIARNEPKLGEQGFDLELYIADITNFSEPTPASKSYTLVCVSKHMYLNNKKLLDGAFQGTPRALVSQIVKTNLDSKLQVSASTKGIIKGIYPNIQPLQAISWLLRNSFDDNTQIYFYESAKFGLVLTSYASILNQNEVYGNYNRNPNPTETMYNSKEEKMFEEERLKIQKMASSLNVSKLNASSKGTFGGVLNKLDISTKTRSDKTVQYDTPKIRLNTFAPINDKMTIDGQKITDFKKFKQHWITYNANAFDNYQNYHNPTQDEALLRSRMSINNLDTTVVDLNLTGDFNLAPGLIISLAILKQADVSEELSNKEGADGEIFDNYVSGAYLVSSITHHFGKEGYNINAKVKKDSFIEEQIRGK